MTDGKHHDLQSAHAKQVEMTNAAHLLTRMTDDHIAFFRHETLQTGHKIGMDTAELAAHSDSFRAQFQKDLNKQNSSALVAKGIIPRLEMNEIRDLHGNPEGININGIHHLKNGGEKGNELVGSYSPFRANHTNDGVGPKPLKNSPNPNALHPHVTDANGRRVDSKNSPNTGASHPQVVDATGRPADSRI
jgi:hypothetical protein